MWAMASISPGWGSIPFLIAHGPPRPNEQLVALLLDVYAEDGADWDETGWGGNHG